MRARSLVLAASVLVVAGLACTTLQGSASKPTPASSAVPTAEPATEGPQSMGTSQVGYLGFLPGMTLTTPTSGNGSRPLLAWESVEGADWYSVYLYGPDQGLYWSWQGRETSVPVGGRPQLNDKAPGPSVADGMTWSVVAYDNHDMPIASGGPRPIAP